MSKLNSCTSSSSATLTTTLSRLTVDDDHDDDDEEETYDDFDCGLGNEEEPEDDFDDMMRLRPRQADLSSFHPFFPSACFTCLFPHSSRSEVKSPNDRAGFIIMKKTGS